MDDMEIDLLGCLLAKHIIEIARSDGYVEHLLLSRLRAISYTSDEETQYVINELISTFD